MDSAAGVALHLDPGGHAFYSPSTAVASGGEGCLWWRALKGVLYIIDCGGLPFTWPGARSSLRRDRPQPGKLAGFGAEGKNALQYHSRSGEKNAAMHLQDTMLNNTRVGHVELARDPWGFLFPGSVYVLSLRLSSRYGTHSDDQHRVVLGGCGSLTSDALGERIGSLSLAPSRNFAGGTSGRWAIGETVVLHVETDYHQVRTRMGSKRAKASLRSVARISDTTRVLRCLRGNQRHDKRLSCRKSILSITAHAGVRPNSVANLNDMKTLTV